MTRAQGGPPDQPTKRGRTKRLVGFLALCCVGASYLAWRSPPPDPELLPVVKPSPPSPPPPRAARPEESAPIALELRLGQATARALKQVTVSELDVVAIWPDALELPELETTERVHAIALSGVNIQDESVHELLWIAEQEGVLGQPDAALASPGRAFVELETARLRAEHLFHHETRAWAQRHLAPGEDLRARFGDIWLHAPDRPLQDFDELLRLCEAIEERFPDHPIADHARTYKVIASLPKGGERGRYRPDLGPALAALSQIEEPGLAEQAATWLTRFDHGTGDDGRALELLSEIEVSSADAEMAIREFAVNRAVKAGDWKRAEDWVSRYAEALKSSCSLEDSDETCTSRREELLEASGRLAALTGRTPASWEEALIAAAWRCHLRGEAQTGTSVGLGAWSGRWRWGEWDVSTPLTACLASEGVEGPDPPGGTRVRLTLRGPAREG